MEAPHIIKNKTKTNKKKMKKLIQYKDITLLIENKTVIAAEYYTKGTTHNIKSNNLITVRHYEAGERLDPFAMYKFIHTLNASNKKVNLLLNKINDHLKIILK